MEYSMAIDKKLLTSLRTGKYESTQINLSGKNLNDKDVKEIIELLDKNQQITELNLSNNHLSKEILALLVQNKTLKTLRLKPGNPNISLKDLCAFKDNTTLTSLPFTGGSGDDIKKLREHIKANATQPKQKKKADKNPLIQANTKKIETVDIKETADIETGQESFLQLAFNLLFDLEDFASEKEYVIWYTAIALNLYMHNASHNPMPGYGKVQKLEKDHILYYSRSQADHPNRIWHDRFSKTDIDTRKNSVSPLNKVLRNLIAQTIQPDEENDDESKKAKKLRDKRQKLIHALRAIDPKRGFPYQGKEIPDYFSLFLAHGGVRVNNLRVLISALEETASDQNHRRSISTLREKFEEYLPKRIPKNIRKLDASTITKRIQAIQERFSLLKKETDKLETQNKLQKKIQHHRSANNEDICNRANQIFNLGNSLLQAKPVGPGCIHIILNKENFSFCKNSTQNHIENFTNVVLGFLIGLINYHAKLKGLSFRVERRQSFGFLTSTLTDAGELTLRLSLGIEPALFNDVIVDSLKNLDFALNAVENYPAKFSKMRSEKKQWQAGFEAQHYLEQVAEDDEEYPATAFQNYLNTFAVEDKYQVTDHEAFCKKQESQKKSKDIFSETPLFALLKNLTQYAVSFVTSFDAYVENSELHHFKQSYWHSLLKLYQHCHDAFDLLNNIDNRELSLAYQEANTHIENILEYLITLDSLKQMQEKMQGKQNIRLSTLTNTEKSHAATHFNLTKEQIQVYFTDSGQQAITTTLLAMDYQLFLDEAHTGRGQPNIYNFNESYFELDLFLKDVGGLKNTNKATSTIAFIDITQLSELDFDEFDSMRALVIDITRQVDLDNEALKKIIADAHERDVWVVLAASCLKNDELGLDKYTTGKIITLAPDQNTKLQSDVTQIFEGISNYGMHSAIASYLQIANEVCGDKFPQKNAKNQTFFAEKGANKKEQPQLTPSGSQGLHRFGVAGKHNKLASDVKQNDKKNTVKSNEYKK